MTSKTKKFTISAASAAAIFSMAGFVFAADEGGDYIVQASFVSSDEPTVQVSCNERNDLARFVHELERTDGDVSPIEAPVSCGTEIYAQSTADAD